jgi:hypothetical protein
MISENDEDRSATTPYARYYQNEQEPFLLDAFNGWSEEQGLCGTACLES